MAPEVSEVTDPNETVSGPVDLTWNGDTVTVCECGRRDKCVVWPVQTVSEDVPPSHHHDEFSESWLIDLI